MTADEAGWPVPWEPVEGDRNGALQQLSTAALRALVAGVASLPWGAHQACVRGVARLAKAVDRRHSDAGRRFVETALGPRLDPARREALVLAAWEHLLTHTLEMSRFDAAVPPERFFEHVETEVSDDVRRMLEERRGGLLLTAHVGAWELAPVMALRLVSLLRSKSARRRSPANQQQLMAVWHLLQHQPRGNEVLAKVEDLNTRRHRASSAIEGFNAALRPHLYVHKSVRQGFLELFRAHFNLRQRRWGRHKGTSAHALITGQPVTDWLSVLGYPPTAHLN